MTQTAAPKVPEWPRYGNFRNVTQNPHLLKECNRGTKDALKVQRLDKILAQKAAPKVPEWPSYGNFCKVTQNPHFLKKCKGETKVSFSKIAKKVALA